MLDRRIKLRHLEAFTTIARMGSLKAACAELHLTQPALSKTLKELEGILGARLLDRDRGGARVTPEGRVFLEYAGMSLAALRRGVEGVGALRGTGAMPLRVGTLPSVAAHLMPGAVTRLREMAPDVMVTLRDGPHAQLVAELREGALDLVIGRQGAPETMQGVSFTQLYMEHVVCVVRPGHPLAGRRVTVEALADWPVIYPPPRAAIRPLVDRWLIAQGAGPLGDRVESVSGAFGRNHTAATDSVWIISEGVVARDLAEGRLVRLPLDMAATAGPVGLMARPQEAPSQARQIFEQAVVLTAQALAGNPS
ncbi:pca operon transcription factor PcaQ [Salipiger mucosus]|uniref:LysR family transcriptional regulator YdcI n=1 Tax=Salipiger mucosus DSM 16094 TaxID=1123237 RepID=S9QLB7_9RHOB|nr:pca operon transcription factor PcaQ [Salipiger mucosus]EPX82251.1 LysR family transcriptional regulator YdcI [Salipiger mucosus DSM 16094]